MCLRFRDEQNQLLAARVETGFGRRLTLRSLILVRLLWPITLYFFVSVRVLPFIRLRIG